MAVLSNADSLLVAVPMIGTLIVGYFRLDELVGKPRKRLRGSQLTSIDAKGRVTCLDPDEKTGETPLASHPPASARRPRPRAEIY